MEGDRVDFSGIHPDWEFAETTEGTTYELLEYPDSLELRLVKTVHDDNSLSDWLTKDLSKQSSGGKAQKPIRGLRLAFLRFGDEDWRIQCRESAATLLYTHLRASGPILFSKSTLATHTSSYYSVMKSDSPRYLGLVLRTPWIYRKFGTRVILFDKKMNMTTALVISSDNPAFQSIGPYGQVKAKWINPLMLSLDFIEQVLGNCWHRISRTQLSLHEITTITGQHQWKDRALPDPFEIDFLNTTRMLNSTSQYGLETSASLTSLLDVMEQLKCFRQAIKVSTDISPFASEDQEFSEKISNITSEIRAAHLESQTCEKISGILTQVLYQFMMQKDAKVNKELAKASAAIAKASKEDSAAMKTIAFESKKDSSAMKTISILGMVFLPGTFIATIFAMPVFDWDADGAPVMKPAFRYYWAITIPLTVTVLLLWSLMTLLPWQRWTAGWKKNSKSNVDSDGKKSTTGA